MTDVKQETWIDKSGWGDGPWQDEPDRVEWTDGEYVCLMLRHPFSGNWCGYVAVSPGHLWHEVDYSDIHGAHVHGGLTYGDHCMIDTRPLRERVCHVTESEDRLWWLGFDCHHAFDFAPGFRARELRMAAKFREEGDVESAELFERATPRDTYRTVEYVRNEIAGLVAQARVAAA